MNIELLENGVCDPRTQCVEKVSIVANTWIKQMHFIKAGDKMYGHKHNFDHQTILASGKFKVYVEDKIAEFEAPFIITVQKHKEHMIEAITPDATAFCVHAIRFGENEEDIMNPDDIPEDKMYAVESYPLLVGKKGIAVYKTPAKARA